jgi:hypothetical protein
VADLTRWAWQDPSASAWEVLRACAPSMLAMVVLTGLAVALATRVFRWEPRR